MFIILNVYIFIVLKVGPVEYVEFAVDEHEICANFAYVVFKYPRSVEESIKLLRGTKLYGLPIVTKKYSTDLEDPAFHEELNYFKQLASVEQSKDSNSTNKSRWNDQSSGNTNHIPESLPEPPTHDKNTYRDTASRQSSRYQHGNGAYRSEPNSTNNLFNSRGRYHKSEHNSNSGSMANFDNERDDTHNQRDYNSRSSSNWNDESSYHNREFLVKNKNNRERDLKDAMYHGNNSKNEDSRQYNGSDSNNRWSERNHKNTRSDRNFSDNGPRKNNYASKHVNESNSWRQNHNDEELDRQNFNQDNLYDNFEEDEYSNNFNNREKSRSNNYKYNNRFQTMESSSRHSSYHPYKQNDEGNERKESKNLYNERSNHGRGKNNWRGRSNDRKW